MRGIFDRVGWRSLLPAARKLARMVAAVEARRGCGVIDLDKAPHWLHRDLGLRDGRPTRQEMRHPPKWPEIR